MTLRRTFAAVRTFRLAFAIIALSLLYAFGPLTATPALAQFGSPVVNGVVAANEYGVHTDGQNQQTTTGTSWYVTWDATNLYVGITNANVGEAAVFYIDKDAALPATSGGIGTTTGQTYDGTRIASLPFLADFVAYHKAGYREFRTGSGWGTVMVGAGAAAESGSTRELAIPWNLITGGAGRPAAFNFLGYLTSAGAFAYGQVPSGNPTGFFGTGATAARYFSVLTTTDGASTKPFSRDTTDKYIATGGYTTLKAAFDAINSGSLTGTVNLYVTGNTTEAASPTLNASGVGAASYAGVTIRPSGGSWTVSGNLNSPIVNLDGADNVTIDGRIGGSGSTRSLTFSNANTTNGSAVLFTNDATNNAVRYTTLKGGPTGGPYGIVTFATTTGTTGNDNITIENNEIAPAGSLLRYALWAAGTTGKENSNVRIADNDFHDWWASNTTSAGIWIQGGNADWTISGNSFYQTVARSGGAGSSYYGIYILPTGGGFTVSGNYVGGSQRLAGGSPQPMEVVNFSGIHLDVSPASPSSIQGNTITNLNVSAPATAAIQWYGILTESAADIGTVTGNTVGSGTATDAVVVTGNASNTAVVGIRAVAGSSCAIQNNVIGGITANGAGVTVDNTGIAASTCLPTLTSNTVLNLTNNATAAGSDLIGISATHGSASTYTGNTVRNLTTASQGAGCGNTAPLLGISLSVGAGFTIADNTVHSLTATDATAPSCVTGMNLSGAASGAQAISNNFVHSLRSDSTLTSQSPAALVGLYFGQSSPSLVASNNRVRLGIDAAGNSITTGYGIAGIALATATRGAFSHNSVYIGGAGVDGSSGVGTAALRNQSTGSTTLNNNIWMNARANASGAAIHSATHFDNTLMTSDYNLLYAPASATLVRQGANNYATTAAWTAASGKDANSTTGDPLLVNPTAAAGAIDLHVDTTGNISPAANAGTPAPGVTVDFENATRNTSYPDIGADEFADTGPLPAGTYARRGVNTGETWTLAGNVTLNTGLGLNGGLLDLGANTLTFGQSAAVLGTPSATTMIIADGGGQVCKVFAAPAAFTYPIGDNTGTADYSPATINFTSGTFATGQACVRVTNAAHPNGDTTNYPTYLSRYWTVTQTGITAFSASVSFSYPEADVTVGSGQTESVLALWKYNPSTWTFLAAGDAVNNVLNATGITSFSDFTGRSASPLAVRLAGFTAELVEGQVVLAWETVSEQDNAGFNVYRGESEAGPWVPANEGLIFSAAPGATEGRAYRWTDTKYAPDSVRWYLLEDVDLNGAARQHGPVRVGAREPNAVTLRSFTGQGDWWSAVVRWLMGR